MAAPQPPITPTRPIVPPSGAPHAKRSRTPLEDDSPSNDILRSANERYHKRIARAAVKDSEKKTGSKLDVNSHSIAEALNESHISPKDDVTSSSVVSDNKEIIMEALADEQQNMIAAKPTDTLAKLAGNDDGFVKVNKAEKEAEKTFWGV